MRKEGYGGRSYPLNMYGLGSDLSFGRISCFDSVWWRDLIDVCGEYLEDGWCDSNVEWKVENVLRINFWHHKWCGNEKLSSKYNKLYNNSLQKDAKLREVGEWSGERWVWRLAWRRPWF